MATFSAVVSDWVKATKERQVAVFRESAQRVVEIAQTPVFLGGRMRVDTGFLRASLSASLNGALPGLMDRPEGGRAHIYDASAVNLVIADANIGDVITLAYAARYAIFREFKGDRFVGMAAQQWPRVVAEVAAEAQRRAGG